MLAEPACKQIQGTAGRCEAEVELEGHLYLDPPYWGKNAVRNSSAITDTKEQPMLPLLSHQGWLIALLALNEVI